MPPEEYGVCLSFAGEDRAYVDAVARSLSGRGVKLFYDAYEEAELWGKDLYQHLDAVYREQARFCVVFLSAAYAQKLWTSHELKSAQARAFSENREYILPARFDSTKIPGMRDTVAYVDLRTKTPEQLADLIANKLERSRSTTDTQANAASASANSKRHDTPSPLRFVALAGVGVLSGMLLGAVTNAINGAVSPKYFELVMKWESVSNIWLASIVQGALEGFIYGLIISLFYTVSVAKHTDFAAPFAFAVKHFVGIIVGTLACWTAGGVFGSLITIANPERWSSAYPSLPKDTAVLIGFGWVAGSIWGAMLGSVASVTVGLLIFRANWKKRPFQVAA